jgi:hypothetical protein
MWYGLCMVYPWICVLVFMLLNVVCNIIVSPKWAIIIIVAGDILIIVLTAIFENRKKHSPHLLK